MDVSKIRTEPHAQGQIEVFRLANAAGAYVDVCNIGAGVTAVVVPDREGRMADVALGYRAYADYVGDGACFGKTPGRFANRIAGGRFTLDGKEYRLTVNNGPNHLHGGPTGFANRLWQGETTGDGVAFTRTSPDGEEGYPGEVTAVITYSLDDTGLTIDYSMSADSRTVVNPSNHSYFNLNGHCSGDVRGHTLHCPVTGSFNQLTEESAPLFEGTDLNEERVLGEIFDCRYPSLEAMGGGIDHKFILSDLSANLKDAGTLYSPESGIEMQCTTTMPCIMIYTGNMVDIDGKNHFHYGKHAGVCFETMLFSSLRDMYGSVAVIEPGKEHRSCTRFTFSLR